MAGAEILWGFVGSKLEVGCVACTGKGWRTSGTVAGGVEIGLEFAKAKEGSELTRNLELLGGRRNEGEFATAEVVRDKGEWCSDVVLVREGIRRNTEVGGVVGTTLVDATLAEESFVS